LIRTSGQQITINEVVSSNSIFYDEDGDSPDWFELHNTTTNDISLEGWTVSDEENSPLKWTFPSVTITPDDYLYIWASGKDRKDINVPRTLIDRQETWKYIIPPQPVNLDWIDLDYNDTNWLEGNTGFGYSDNDDDTIIPAGTAAVFMRKKFTVSELQKIEELILDIDYDDAFVAYINGEEVARANIEGNRPGYNDFSITDHEAQIYSGGRPDRFLISTGVLQEGENVLSIQAHNVGVTSSDFTLIPFLSAVYSKPTNEGKTPPEILNLKARTLHTNFKISNGETLFLFDADGNEVDKLFVSAPSDISLGRRISDNNIVLFDPPSPGIKNKGAGFEGYLVGEVGFSNSGGKVEKFDLMLSGAEAEEVIRYTLDATIPDWDSPIYQAPITIEESTVVRARLFREGYIPSDTQTKTYLTNVSHDIPVVSLVTDPVNLFDEVTGIYAYGDNYQPDLPFFGANFWQDWERPIHFTLYEEDNTSGTNFDAGVKIFGGWSRAQDQRSFSIFARGKYGTDEIDYPLFPSNNYEKYQALVLRNGGNDWLRSNIRDGVLTTLMDGSGLETQAFRSVSTYLNGQYWGLYHMREKINEHYIASRHGVNPNDIDLMGNFGELLHGDDSDYIQLHNFLENNSLVGESNYKKVSEQIDIENVIIYNVAQIYFNNTDWPGNNVKYWKPKEGKWRWILFDTDFGFGVWNPNSYAHNTLSFALEPNGPGWPNPPSSTLLLRRLTSNEQFRHQFINQFADELNSRFLPYKVEEHISKIADNVNNEMVKHYERWDGSIDFHNEQVEVMLNFAKNRPAFVKAHIKSTFGLPAFHKITLRINSPSAGYVKLNSLSIRNPYWQGDYFESVPIKLTAVAKSGHVFSHWSGDINSTSPNLTVDMKTAMTIDAIFETTSAEQIAVINEINYHSLETEDAGDWVEIFNPSDNILDLSDWVFTDTDFEGGYIFPKGTIIGENDFLVLTRDELKFKIQHPEVDHIIGNIDFGLSKEGDNLRIYNSTNILIDSVRYDSSQPWPEMADGLGYTLELVSPELDNALAENWTSINHLGSPGKANVEATSTKEKFNSNDLKIFPNPFVDHTVIEFSLDKTSIVQIDLFNAMGSKVKSIFDGILVEGEHQLINDLSKLNRGSYYLFFATDGYIHTAKWIKI
jgi:hypothetical protein